MTACILLAVALVGCPAPDGPPMLRTAKHPIVAPAATPHRDPWLGEDKLRHFAMSFAATTFAYAATRPVLDPDHARMAAATAAITAGIGKEIHDARAGRFFSLRDMAWNLAGVAVGLILIQQTR